MASESKPIQPGSDEWWAYFNGLTLEPENSSLCKRVHPVIADWLQSAFLLTPHLDTLLQEKFIKLFKDIRKDPEFQKIPADTTDDARKRDRFFFVAGRLCRAFAPVEFSEDTPEVKQAITCLLTEILLALANGIAEDEDTGDLFIQDPSVDLAERIFGEENARHALGVMVIGWLFQGDLDEGQFDDM